jgi:zinc transport system substrate-binding protein
LGKRVMLLAIAATCLLLFSGCAGDVSDSGAKPSATNGQGDIIIVTSFYPVYVATINVTRGVEGVRVINMTQPQTGCLHDYQLTPADMKIIGQAKFFVINGAGMEAFLDKVVRQQPQLKIIDASKGIELLKNKNGEPNPHVWVSISNAIRQADNIAAELAAADSAHAAKYRSNAAEYAGKLAGLRAIMLQSLAGARNKDIVTFHEAFPYFAQEFSLNVVAVVEREPGTEPSPEELAGTIRTVKAAKVKALFAEPQYSAKAAEVIGRETGVKVYLLDPAVTGDTGAAAYDSYLKAMEHNLRVLQEALL